MVRCFLEGTAAKLRRGLKCTGERGEWLVDPDFCLKTMSRTSCYSSRILGPKARTTWTCFFPVQLNLTMYYFGNNVW